MLKCNIVGILTFMSQINIILSRVEQEKSFITLEPDVRDFLSYPNQIFKFIFRIRSSWSFSDFIINLLKILIFKITGLDKQNFSA